MQFPVSEILAAGVDYIAMACGVDVTNPHPLARDLSLRKIAEAAGRRLAGGYQSDERALASTGLNTGDFGRALADGVAQVVTTRFANAAAHRRFTGLVEVPNFRLASVPTLDTEIQLEPVSEGGEIRSAHVTVGGGATAVWLQTFARNLLVGRHAVIGNDVGTIAAMIAGAASSGARKEATLVVTALESPADLDDGQPVFDASFANVQTGAFDATTLAAAMAKLRLQKLAGGGAADLELRHLVVAPDLEFAVTKLIYESGLFERVQITTMAGLPTGRWYALADAEVSPTIVVLQLAGVGPAPGAPRVPIRIEPLSHKPNDLEGVALRAIADLAATMVSRIGVVRGNA